MALCHLKSYGNKCPSVHYQELTNTCNLPFGRNITERTNILKVNKDAIPKIKSHE